MFRKYIVFLLVVLAVVACVVFSYILPTVIERLLVSRIGPFWAYVMLGDVVGCAALGALTRWRIGIALYVLLDVVEAILFRTHVLSTAAMMWVADAVPTLILCCLAIMVIRVRGGWHLNSDS